MVSPDYYNNPWERYAYADPQLTDTAYDSIKDLKDRIAKEDLDLRIDSHKGFLRCEEANCEFALKIRYGSSKGHVILGKSRHDHNHEFGKSGSLQKKKKTELLQRYYDVNVARGIKLKKALQEIERELGEPLTGDDLKKFKNKIYNIRQKLRRESGLENTTINTSAVSSNSTTITTDPTVVAGASAGTAETTTVSNGNNDSGNNNNTSKATISFERSQSPGSPAVTAFPAPTAAAVSYAAQQQQQQAPALHSTIPNGTQHHKLPPITSSRSSKIEDTEIAPEIKKLKKREPLVAGGINPYSIKNIVNEPRQNGNANGGGNDSPNTTAALAAAAIKRRQEEEKAVKRDNSPVLLPHLLNSESEAPKPRRNPIPLPMPKKRKLSEEDATVETNDQNASTDPNTSTRFSAIIRKFI